MQPLEKIVTYSNVDVIDSYTSKYGLPRHEVKDIFDETVKWLWLCANDGNILNEMLGRSNLHVIDTMWNSFILFTKEYEQFCDSYFGFFLHKTPTTYTSYVNMNNYRLLYKEQLSIIYDKLGEETVLKWDKYGDKYNVTALFNRFKSFNN